MSRVARELSWHAVAFALVVAGLTVLAPLAWQRSHEPADGSTISQQKHRIARYVRDHRSAGQQSQLAPHCTAEIAIQRAPAPQPQVAALGPLIADQIDLDPSVSETPALPVAHSATAIDPPREGPPEEPRLSSTLVRPTQPRLPDSKELETVRQPAESRDASPFLRPESAFPPTKGWPYPLALIEQLRSLGQTTPRAAAWSEQVVLEIERLVQAGSLADPAIKNSLERLHRLCDEAKVLAQPVSNLPSRSAILRAGYAVVRRLVIWDMVHTLAGDGDLAAAPIVDRRGLIAALDNVDALLPPAGTTGHWRSYLQLDRARAAFDSPEFTGAPQRELAREILHRMHSSQLSRAQEHFVQQPPIVAFQRQLQAWAAVAPDLTALLRAIEQYEYDDRSANARALAGEYDVLRWSAHDGVRELAERVNAYYRNANIRVALSSDLLNRMIPAQTPQVEAVEDNILGAWVSGISQTNTKVRIVLVPDEHRWNIGLEAQGEVASDTASSKGPATFYQRGWSMFRARKRVTVDRRGIRMFSAEAQANANTDLNDFETDFDGIPLLGGLARSIARTQYDASQSAAKVEVEGKIIVRAVSQLDREVTQKLEQAKNDFQLKMIKPLRDLGLEPTAVDMETTRERLIARYRMASREELSAHTPRPQAPGDSMLSVQIHESALNNVLESLALNGRRMELSELYKEMAGRFNTTRNIEIPEDLPENVFVTFADEDPVRVDCQDGRVQLTIRLKELMQAGTRNRWANFTVQAYYYPTADQLDANLQREGIIELIGDGRPLPLGQRMALNAIFTKVLSKSRKLHVINRQISNSPQLRDQQVTQFVIHDGWIGVAVGRQTPGRQAAMTPRPEIRHE
jgi:hypothetical protein